MKRHQWMIYWIGIASIQGIVQLFYCHSFLNQPTLGEYYTGKTVVYSIFAFGLSGLIFISANIYAFVICLKNKKKLLWFQIFCSSILFLILSELVLNKFAETFFPLNVWGQSTSKELLERHNQK